MGNYGQGGGPTNPLMQGLKKRPGPPIGGGAPVTGPTGGRPGTVVGGVPGTSSILPPAQPGWVRPPVPLPPPPPPIQPPPGQGVGLLPPPPQGPAGGGLAGPQIGGIMPGTLTSGGGSKQPGTPGGPENRPKPGGKYGGGFVGPGIGGPTGTMYPPRRPGMPPPKPGDPDFVGRI